MDSERQDEKTPSRLHPQLTAPLLGGRPQTPGRLRLAATFAETCHPCPKHTSLGSMGSSGRSPIEPSPNHLLLTERGNEWISGFDPADRDAARKLVNGLTLVSLSVFARVVERLVREQAHAIDGPVALFAAREVGSNAPYFGQASGKRRRRAATTDAVSRGADIGSEGHVASTLRNTCRATPDSLLNHPSIAKMREERCRAIVVVDDIVGSGNRIRKFLDSMWQSRTIRSWWSSGYIKFFVVAFAATSSGMLTVQRARYRPCILTDRDCPTYRSLPWAKSERNRVSRLSQKYGQRTSKPGMAMGYGDTMASLVFEHGCPNNAPSILWANGSPASPWQPLFPNRSVLGEERSVFPPEIARRDPISILLEAGQSRLAKTATHRLQEPGRAHILVILGLVAKGIRRNASLTFATGMSNAELEIQLSRCIDWGLVTATRRITPTGLAELNRARRDGVARAPVAELTEENYYPRTLRGHIGG